MAIDHLNQLWTSIIIHCWKDAYTLEQTQAAILEIGLRVELDTIADMFELITDLAEDRELIDDRKLT